MLLLCLPMDVQRMDLALPGLPLHLLAERYDVLS